MPPRLFIDDAIGSARLLALPASAARHVQVLRLQPGDDLMLFDGRGGQWTAQVAAMSRQGVQVQVLLHQAQECELVLAVTLAVAMPANDRMDDLVEKATELGVAAIQPLLSERSVLRLAGERALRRQAHWQAIAAAACEQCGRNRVPAVRAVQTLAAWLGSLAPAASGEARLMLGWRDARPWPQADVLAAGSLCMLSGPEGGLSDGEEDQARRHGFAVTSLGPRVLRADTAPLAALAAIALAAT